MRKFANLLIDTDRFGQQPSAMVEQIDRDRFWFTSLGKARHFMQLHGILEIPEPMLEKLRADRA